MSPRPGLCSPTPERKPAPARSRGDETSGKTLNVPIFRETKGDTHRPAHTHVYKWGQIQGAASAPSLPLPNRAEGGGRRPLGVRRPGQRQRAHVISSRWQDDLNTLIRLQNLETKCCVFFMNRYTKSALGFSGQSAGSSAGGSSGSGASRRLRLERRPRVPGDLPAVPITVAGPRGESPGR